MFSLSLLVRKIFLKFYKLKFIKILTLYFINLLTCIIKVDNSRVLFGAMNGRFYGDNSKYVYEWILINRSDLNPVWMTANKDAFTMLEKKGFPVAYTPSLNGMYMVLSSPVAFFTNSLRDFAIDPFFVPNRLHLVSLRHGRSVKRVRFARLGHEILPLEALERLRESKLVHSVISTSPFISDIQEECLRLGKNKHVITGYPRNDKLFSPEKFDKESFENFTSDANYKRVVLYAPTWRHGRNPVEFFPFDDFEKETLIKFLDEHRVLLLIRSHVGDLHYSSLSDYLSTLASSSIYIKLAHHRLFPDVNSLLPFVDALVCDYSALYHDYLLLNRPMIFIPYDYEKFSRDNGFLYDYFKLLPGPKISNLKSFISELSDIVSGNDKFEKQRHHLKKLVHLYDDDKSTSRVVKILDQIRAEIDDRY